MKNIAIFIAVLLIFELKAGYAYVAADENLAFKYDPLWMTWKQVHDKSYDSDIHELEKYVTWVSNHALIETHNQLESRFGYSLAMNQFGDMVRW